MWQLLLKEQWIGNLSWLNEVYTYLPSILYAILAIVGGAGTVYAVILGVNLAKSENDEKRRYAAFRIRNTLIGVVCLLALVLFINLALPAILKKIYGSAGWGDIDKDLGYVPPEDENAGAGGTINFIRPLLHLLFH